MSEKKILLPGRAFLDKNELGLFLTSQAERGCKK